MSLARARLSQSGAILCAALTTAVACSPVEMARTANVAHPGQVSGAWNVSFTTTRTHTHYVSPSGSGTASGDGGNVMGIDHWLAPLAAIPLFELGGAIGVTPGCEVGGRVRLIGLHAETRCQLVGYGAPTPPVALAASLGGGLWAHAKGEPYARLGVDSTFALGSTGLLLGLYGRYGRRTHSLTNQDLPDEPGDWDFDLFGDGDSISVEHTELRLSAPLGVAWLVNPDAKPSNATRLVLGIVPSLIAFSSDRTADCTGCDPALDVTGYSEDYTVAAVLGVEWGGTK